MAHFAKLDDSNNVLAIVPVADADAATESAGVSHLTTIHGHTNWKQCSYNTREGKHYQPDSDTESVDQTKALRANFPGIGWTYDSTNDIFVEPKPFDSWTLNTTTGKYAPSTARPTEAQQIIDADAGTAHWPYWSETNSRWESTVEGNYYWDGSSWVAF
jgi:hypothetical protein